MSSHNLLAEITPPALKAKLDAGDKPFLLDVREPHEIKICQLEHSFNIPLGDLRFRIAELNEHKDKEIVVICRSGKRSAMAAQFLQENGFNNVLNLDGGMLGWSDQVDPSCPKY